jgi:hypothetical protein
MMRRLRFALGAFAVSLTTGCPDDTTPASGSSDTGSPDTGNDSIGSADTTSGLFGAQPFRDEWRVAHEGAFSSADVQDIRIGNALGYGDNFVNRGDVIVDFSGAAGEITIELRRFTWAGSEAQAQEDFDDLLLWAYDDRVDMPAAPADMDPTTRCDGDTPSWPDGCAIYVYYDHLAQLQRSGADIRVTLPADYRNDIAISTADNLAEEDYPNHGDVCVSNLNASIDVELQSGLAFVTLAPETTPSPECESQAPDLFQDCIGGAEPWALSCGCIAQGYPFGSVKIDSLEPSAPSITVDIAQPTLWTAFRAENAGMNDLMGMNCPASVEGIDNVEFAVNDPSIPWRLIGEANHPSASAPAGAGFSLQLTANACAQIYSVESPGAWDPDLEPEASLRGPVAICAGCLAGMSCDVLLPD